jgi:hypothetical protein
VELIVASVAFLKFLDISKTLWIPAQKHCRNDGWGDPPHSNIDELVKRYTSSLSEKDAARKDKEPRICVGTDRWGSLAEDGDGSTCAIRMRNPSRFTNVMEMER